MILRIKQIHFKKYKILSLCGTCLLPDKAVETSDTVLLFSPLKVTLF